MPRNIPKFTTNAEAEAFLEQDLSNLDFTQFKPVRFGLREKDARVNMRLPQGLLDSLKARAEAQRIPYQRLMQDLLERGLGIKLGAGP
jgi:predicted DNA binding CopG/RHH family protein